MIRVVQTSKEMTDIKLILVYLFALAADLIHANDEPQSKVVDDVNLSRTSEHVKFGNHSRRVESPRTLPIPINDAIYESELVKDTGVRGLENHIDRSMKLNPEDLEPVNIDEEDEVSKSDLQTADNKKLDSAEDDEKSSRRSGTESVKKDIETTSEVSESDEVDTTKSVHKNEDPERAAKNVDKDNLSYDSTHNNEERVSVLDEDTNAIDSSSEGLILLGGHRRMLNDDEIFDTKARSGHNVRNYGAINSHLVNNIKPAQPFGETENVLSYQRLNSPIAEFQFPLQQSTLDLTSHEFAKTSKHDRNTYEYIGSPATMIPNSFHVKENLEKSHVATLAPIATPAYSSYSYNRNVHRNADSLVNDPFLFNIIKMADMTKNNNRFYFPNPPMVTTPIVHPFLLQRYPPLQQIGSYKLY